MKIGDKVSFLNDQLKGTIIDEINLSKNSIKDMYWEVGRVTSLQNNNKIIFRSIYAKEEELTLIK